MESEKTAPQNLQKPKILVVCGPTGAGKSALALQLAAKFGGGLISADSMQIYKGLLVGTAATTQQKAGKVPLYLSGFLPPQQEFSVAQWAKKAGEIVAHLQQKAVLPVLCGGTGLYIQSLLSGQNFKNMPKNSALRSQLYTQWDEKGPSEMHALLAQIDKQRADILHINDKKRILRSLENSMLTGKTAKRRQEEAQKNVPPFNALILGLCYKERQNLYSAINARADEMLENGLLAEAKTVWQNQSQYKTAAQAIGYKEFFAYFDGTKSLEECAEKLKQASRNYAKRQLTWFCHMPNVVWLYKDQEDTWQKAQKLAGHFLREDIPFNG